ncbi:MAG: TIGR03013 family PEP-CTERM/XrtA system glycosyltransferase [Desulfotignum sp.]|nr:TIGR03013 family PEP-CTERM/XrtA system glycosyltransferase [Desulfotignum sp.]MCF8112803.1 TIGR03013 family PEP-CTERM/XrtA system glycosyltransferase [Desulfotignum sp.]
MGLLDRGSLIYNRIVLMAGDILAGLTILAVVVSQSREMDTIALWVVLFIPVVLFFSFLCEVYQPQKWIFKERLIRSFAAITLSLLFLAFFPAHPDMGFWQLFGVMFVFFLAQNTWQSLFHKSNDAHFFAEKILVIGTGTIAQTVENLIQKSPGKYALIGYIRTPKDPVSVDTSKIIGHFDDIVTIARQTHAHAIVIALTERRGNLMTEKLVTCKLMGVKIVDYPSFYERLTGKIPVEHINPSWLVQSRGFLITPFIRLLKKLLDLGFASMILIICLPFLPLVALAIKLDSSGPVFYFQQRVGLNGNLFTIYKFRSMQVGSEQDSGATWAREDDPRTTRVGTLMRRTRIDELPQLVNVLKGEMSFIGPRPERPEFVEQISRVTPYYAQRHAVKPGITGWAQVMYPYGASLGDAVEKLRYDLYYINNLSLFLELYIIFETIKIVLFRRGGR